MDPRLNEVDYGEDDLISSLEIFRSCEEIVKIWKDATHLRMKILTEVIFQNVGLQCQMEEISLCLTNPYL